MQVAGKVVVVTGGGNGIGRAMCEAFHRAGAARVVVADIDPAAARVVATPIGGAAFKCDVGKEKDILHVIEETEHQFGPIALFCSNAGIGGGGRRAFIDRTEEEWRKMFATNLDGVFHVFQVAARHMTERAEAGDKFGRLVATSSLASLFGTARNEHYAGTKAALNALCRALGVELARYGVTANAILPGWIKSDMTAGIMANDKFVANVMPRIPARRFGEPSDFGGIAVYLMSKASSYHTADCFVIDGGYTAF